MARVPASKKTHALKEMCAGKTPADRSALVRQAARLIVQEALEKEAVESLGRGYYDERASDRCGYRNGYRTGRVKSAEGEIEFAMPQTTDMAQPFRSTIRDVLRGRTQELERLATSEMYGRGLSVRDIEAAFTDEAGRCPAFQGTAASELTERLLADYEAFASRDLAELKVLYLFVDRIAERLQWGPSMGWPNVGKIYKIGKVSFAGN